MVKLGARRAPSLTQADGCAVHAGCGPFGKTAVHSVRARSIWDQDYSVGMTLF